MAVCVVGVMQRWLPVCCTHATISFTGSRKHFSEEAARGLVSTFTEQVEHVVGALADRSRGESMEELAREWPCEGSLTDTEMGTYIGALVGDVGN